MNGFSGGRVQTAKALGPTAGGMASHALAPTPFLADVGGQPVNAVD
jgi:hypothetical protein